MTLQHLFFYLLHHPVGLAELLRQLQLHGAAWVIAALNRL